VTYDPAQSPTRVELEAAWQVLIALGIRKIGDVSLGEYGRVIAGSSRVRREPLLRRGAPVRRRHRRAAR
jgi:hypothetical protein